MLTVRLSQTVHGPFVAVVIGLEDLGPLGSGGVANVDEHYGCN